MVDIVVVVDDFSLWISLFVGTDVEDSVVDDDSVVVEVVGDADSVAAMSLLPLLVWDDDDGTQELTMQLLNRMPEKR